ncbi:MAG TPA: PPC domain-containing DNA-binding protein [Sumerlaeia bacterium]|nr:PPC domain-containing DNA-binding protein [Sumerlaeia bacterium]
MNVMKSAAPTRTVVIGLQPGEMLLESIRDAARAHGIENGAVASGIGTLKTCRMHYIEHTDFPPSDRFYTLEKPLELLSVSGVIADGEPHLHIVVSCGEGEVYAGHLEDGSEVLYLAEIVIQVFNDLKLTRRLDPERGIRLLGSKEQPR